MINDSFSNVTSPRLIQDWNSTKVTSIVASNMVASSGSWATRWPHVLFISSFTRTPEWIFLLSPVRFPRENSLALIFKYYVSSADKGTPLEFFNTNFLILLEFFNNINFFDAEFIQFSLCRDIFLLTNLPQQSCNSPHLFNYFSQRRNSSVGIFSTRGRGNKAGQSFRWSMDEQQYYSRSRNHRICP